MDKITFAKDYRTAHQKFRAGQEVAAGDLIGVDVAHLRARGFLAEPAKQSGAAAGGAMGLAGAKPASGSAAASGAGGAPPAA